MAKACHCFRVVILVLLKEGMVVAGQCPTQGCSEDETALLQTRSLSAGGGDAEPTLPEDLAGEVGLLQAEQFPLPDLCPAGQSFEHNLPWDKKKHPGCGKKDLDLFEFNILQQFAPWLAKTCMFGGCAYFCCPKTDCIQSPEEWWDHYKKGTFKCVSPTLFGALWADGTLDSRLTNGWLSGSANLENFLKINKYFKHTQKAAGISASRITVAIAVIVGFPKSAIQNLRSKANGGFGTGFTVFEYPNDAEPAVVPSWEQLFLYMERLGLQEIPFSDTRDLTLAYSKGKDPIVSFSAVTGCKLKVVRDYINGEGIFKGPGAPADFSSDPNAKAKSNCDADFYKALDALKKPTGEYFQQKDCFTKFQEGRDKKKFTVNKASLRALFFKCFDANVLFSGQGLGFTNLASPLFPCEGNKDDAYTGREFVSANFKLSDINQITKDLPEIPAGAGLSYLDRKNGFYDGCAPTPKGYGKKKCNK